jgi:hypothetical protein
MKQTAHSENHVETKFYLPSIVAVPTASRIESAVTDVFGGHGVVPIPETYNE